MIQVVRIMFGRVFLFTFFTFVSVFSGHGVAATYQVAGTFTSIGSYVGAGQPNLVTGGTMTVEGTVQTDTTEPGYAILGGDLSLHGDFDVTALGFDVVLTLTLSDSVVSDAGIVFNAGTVCVGFSRASGCDIGSFAIGVDGFPSVDFSSNNFFLGVPITGFRLTGGAGGPSFTVSQPGGVTAELGPDGADWEKAVGFVSVPVVVTVNAGLFVEGDLSFTEIEQPNLVVVQVDDLSVDAFQVLLDGGWLPNIATHLVAPGVSFENSFVTTPEGTPSRTTLLTGQYAHNHQVFSNLTPRPLDGGITWEGWLPNGAEAGTEGSTLATWLQSAGYRTGFVGKYLGGYGLQAPVGVADPAAHVPAGWDEWQGLIGSSANRMYDYYLSDNGTLVNFGVSEPDYQTDVLAAKATGFIEADDASPFLLVVTPGAPRVEILDALDFVTGNDPLKALGLGVRPAPRHAHLIDGSEANGEIPGLPGTKPSFNAADVAARASCPRDLPPVAPALITSPFCIAQAPLLAASDVDALSQQYKETLAAMLAVDDLVGDVIDSLNAAEQLDNTVIVFTSDNGRLYGEHRGFDSKLAYEESIRVPLIIRAPGARTGVSDSSLVLNNDLAPTLADYAGIEPGHTVDGISLLPLLDQAPQSAWGGREHFLIEHWYMRSLLKHDAPTYLAWRGKIGSGADFTYIATRAKPDDFDIEVTSREFYDLNADPFQQTPVVLPEATADYFDLLLRVFEGCAGTACRNYEMQ